ncbi:MAG: hypothetical protein NTV22_01750 [bacterium]|nr:hypothetical protein [bacterium]
MSTTRRCKPAGLLTAVLLLAALRGLATDLTNWPAQYKIMPWETAKLTAGDVVGPDGIVYPDWRRAGVEGGIPDITNTAIRASYTIYTVTNYGAVANDGVADDAAATLAFNAALANASGGGKSIIYFPAGIFNFTSALPAITASNVVVQGAGRSATTLQIGVGSTAGSLIKFNGGTTWNAPYRTPAFVPRGATNVTVDSASGYAVGNIMYLQTYLPTATSLPTNATMSVRYNWPASDVIYHNQNNMHFGRVNLARITAISGATITVDRPFVHDMYADESLQVRRADMLSGCGLQDLRIETDSASCQLNPVEWLMARNCWIKHVYIAKALNWPIANGYNLLNCEVRDCVFSGTWANINNGSTAYLGWSGYPVDCLMENCAANDLRHMGIFQGAIRCVIRNCNFSGATIASPQLHGQLPSDCLIEGTTFNTPGSAQQVDGMASLRHGVEGPRFVLYGNTFTNGRGSFEIWGGVEGHIIAYNKAWVTDDAQKYSTFIIKDRSWDGIMRGNVVQASTNLPFINFNNATCYGWDVRDNVVKGCNGLVAQGNSRPQLQFNNRRSAFAGPLPDPAPNAASIFDWERANAALARLVLVPLQSTVLPETTGATTFRVTRVQSATNTALTVSLSNNLPAAVSLPASVSIPANAVYADFVVTAQTVAGGEQTVTITAYATGLLGDTDKVYVQDSAMPVDFLGDPDFSAPGLPANWKKGAFGQVTTGCAASYDTNTSVFTLQGGGLPIYNYDGNLGRSGRVQAWQTVDGDGEISAQVASANGVNQVGVIIALDEAPNTEHIIVLSNGRVISSSYDWQSYNKPSDMVASAGNTVPLWLRLQRQGSVFTAYKSTVGPGSWTQIYRTDFYAHVTAGTGDADYLSRSKLDRRMHFGLLLNSGALNSSATATFTGVLISGTVVTVSYTISGTITNAATGAAVVAVVVSSGTRSAVTDSGGAYAITNVPNGVYTLTPTLFDYTFRPVTRSVTVNGADQPGQDFAAIPEPALLLPLLLCSFRFKVERC